MRIHKICRRLLAAALCIGTVISIVPNGMSSVRLNAASEQCGDYEGYNVGAQSYHQMTETMRSFLTQTTDGQLMRVQSDAVEGKYLVEYYDASYNLQKTLKVSEELPMFGGFYATDSNYYILSGQKNPDESAEVECFRITKYDLNWKRIASAGLYDCNTIYPFYVSSARFAECGQYLLIRTGHQMYLDEHDIGHQANVTIQLDTKSMKITDSLTDVSNISQGYVSHSFNQFIHVEDNKIVAVDHGDAIPRSIVLTEYQTDVSAGTFVPNYFNSCEATAVLVFPDTQYYNYTGASVGGFEISDTSYLVAYNSVEHDANYKSRDTDTRNIFVASVDKETSEVTIKQFTDLTDGEGTNETPHLVKLSDNSFMLLWAYKTTVYYAKLDAEGNPVGKINSIDHAALSDCQPIVSNGKVIWYTWVDNEITFYDIDISNPAKYNTKTVTNGHRYEVVSYPSEAGGNCTLKCAKCGYTTTFATDESMYVSWYMDGTLTASSAIIKDKFFVGERVDVNINLSPDEGTRSDYIVTVSDPDGVEYTKILNENDYWLPKSGYFTFKKAGIYELTITCKYNPLLTTTQQAIVMEPDPVLGDVNNDGKVTDKDATVLLKYLNGQDVDADLTLSDVNADGKWTLVDVALIQQYARGQAVELQ